MVTNAQNPIEALPSEISSIQSAVNALQDGVRLTNLRSEVEQMDNTTDGLPQKISGLRGRGYAFNKGLEGRVADLKARWDLQRANVLAEVTRQSNLLDIDMRSLEGLLSQLSARANDPVNANPLLAQAKSSVNGLQSKVSAAESAVRAMVSSFGTDLQEIGDQLTRVDWMLTQLTQACFQLLPTEAGVMAVDAVWLESNKETSEDPKGVFYLTDQRLIFEQKQEVATKKFLFIATEKQKIQKLQFEFPVELVETIKPTKQGLFGHEDHLELTTASGAPVRNAHLHLNGQDCNEWQGLINQVKSGDMANNRAISVAQADVEKVKSAPTQCPVCGAAITQPVLRGMDSIKCEYCGNVIRL